MVHSSERKARHDDQNQGDEAHRSRTGRGPPAGVGRVQFYVEVETGELGDGYAFRSPAFELGDLEALEELIGWVKSTEK